MSRVQQAAAAGNGSHQPLPSTTLYANPAAERALLGALATRGLRDDLARVERDDFTIESHRILFDTIARRLDAGEPIDCVLLADAVRGAGVSAVEVFDLFEEPGVSVPVYIPIVRGCRVRRMLHSLGACLPVHASDPAREPRDVLRWLERQVGLIQAVAARR
jgi:replicative DNA helicase